MNRPKKWTIIVDPDKKTEISYNITFKQDNVRVFLKMYVDSLNNKVYVDAPIKDPSVRQRLIRFVDRL